MLDMTKITPAPWSHEMEGHGDHEDFNVNGPDGEPILCSCDQQADAAFCALARNALDVQMHHPSWRVESCMDKEFKTWWRVEDDNDQTLGEPQRDPYSALVSAASHHDVAAPVASEHATRDEPA